MLALSRRSAGGPVPSVELIAGHIVALFHALFLSRYTVSFLRLRHALERHISHALLTSCVGSIATDVSTYILLGVDFVINLFFTGQIYWYHREGKVDKCGAALMTLVLNEFLEMTVPLTFLLCFLVSFYGGNAFIIGEKGNKCQIKCMSGNVGNDYFHFVATGPNDVLPFVYTFMILITIDLLSLVFSSIFLKKVLNINLFQVTQ